MDEVVLKQRISVAATQAGRARGRLKALRENQAFLRKEAPVVELATWAQIKAEIKELTEVMERFEATGKSAALELERVKKQKAPEPSPSNMIPLKP